MGTKKTATTPTQKTASKPKIGLNDKGLLKDVNKRKKALQDIMDEK